MAYTTPEMVQYELRADTAFSTDTNPTLSTVNSWITEIDTYIDTLAGRTFGITSHTEDLDCDGSDYIVLKHAPINSITSIQYATFALGDVNYPTYDTLSEDSEFTTYEEQGKIVWIRENFKPNVGRKRFLVSYDSGSSDIPGDVQMLST